MFWRSILMSIAAATVTSLVVAVTYHMSDIGQPGNSVLPSSFVFGFAMVLAVPFCLFAFPAFFALARQFTVNYSREARTRIMLIFGAMATFLLELGLFLFIADSWTEMYDFFSIALVVVGAWVIYYFGMTVDH